MYKILSFIGSWQTLASTSILRIRHFRRRDEKSKFTFTSCLWKKSKNSDDQTRTFIGAFFHETNKKVAFAWKVSFDKFPSVAIKCVKFTRGKIPDCQSNPISSKWLVTASMQGRAALHLNGFVQVVQAKEQVISCCTSDYQNELQGK